MPFYYYEHDCGYGSMLQRKVGEHILESCPGCRAPDVLRPVINRATAPNIMLSSVSNRMYNNGMGYYDVGLGKQVYSREHRRSIMKEMDVHEADRMSAEEFVERSTAEQDREADISLDYVKDRYEYYRAEVEKGKRPEEKPLPENFNPKMLGGE